MIKLHKDCSFISGMSETATKCLVDQSDTLSIESRRSNADISSLEDSLFAPLITAAGLSRQLQDVNLI